MANIIEWLLNLRDNKQSTIEIEGCAFVISPSARRRLVQRFAIYSKYELSGQQLVPLLMHAVGYRAHDENGNQFSDYNGSHFVTCGDDASRHVDTPSFELEGIRIFIGAETIKALNGKSLILKTVNVGWPSPSSKRVALLMAR